MSRVLVTGSDGFIGRALVPRLKMDGHTVRCGLGKLAGNDPAIVAALDACEQQAIGDIGPDTDWSAALRDVDTVIHLAARAHILRETAADPLAAFRRVNTAGTERLARAAVEAGVRRMVFVSSIGVHGNANHDGPMAEDSPIRPDKPYAVSKWEAECALQQIAGEYALEVVVLRPPLAYGPQVRGNFRRLLDWAHKAWPLPLGGINNRRTFIALDNLTDALALCATHENAAGNTFVVGDIESVSTPELMRMLAAQLGRPCRLVPVPESLVRLSAQILGRSDDADRLLGSLEVDSTRIRTVLGWSPRLALDEGLARMCAWYKQEVARD
jgi:nucleoside-diphosphate-sugar epimerase